MVIISLLVLGIIFFGNEPIRNLKTTKWLILFTGAVTLDIISTYLCVHAYNMDWDQELDPAIHTVARFVGYDASLIVTNVFSIVSLYLIYKIVMWLRPRYTSALNLLLFLLISIRVNAAISNTLLPYAIFPDFFEMEKIIGFFTST